MSNHNIDINEGQIVLPPMDNGVSFFDDVNIPDIQLNPELYSNSINIGATDDFIKDVQINNFTNDASWNSSLEKPQSSTERKIEDSSGRKIKDFSGNSSGRPDQRPSEDFSGRPSEDFSRRNDQRPSERNTERKPWEIQKTMSNTSARSNSTSDSDSAIDVPLDYTDLFNKDKTITKDDADDASSQASELLPSVPERMSDFKKTNGTNGTNNNSYGANESTSDRYKTVNIAPQEQNIKVPDEYYRKVQEHMNVPPPPSQNEFSQNNYNNSVQIDQRSLSDQQNNLFQLPTFDSELKEKIFFLVGLQEFQKVYGVKYFKELSKYSLDELRVEYQMQKTYLNKRDGIEFIKKCTSFIISSLEYIITEIYNPSEFRESYEKFGLIKLRLQGWAASFDATSNTHDNVIGKLYDKYMAQSGGMPPELEFLIAIIFSAISVHFSAVLSDNLKNNPNLLGSFAGPLQGIFNNIFGNNASAPAPQPSNRSSQGNPQGFPQGFPQGNPQGNQQGFPQGNPQQQKFNPMDLFQQFIPQQFQGQFQGPQVNSPQQRQGNQQYQQPQGNPQYQQQQYQQQQPQVNPQNLRQNMSGPSINVEEMLSSLLGGSPQNSGINNGFPPEPSSTRIFHDPPLGTLFRDNLTKDLRNNLERTLSSANDNDNNDNDSVYSNKSETISIGIANKKGRNTKKGATSKNEKVLSF